MSDGHRAETLALRGGRLRYLARRAIDAACAAAIVASVWLIWTGRSRGGVEARHAVREPGWRDAVRIASFASNGAKDTLLIFSDYQCPGCRTLHRRLDTWMRQEGRALSVGILHFPLSYHPQAAKAAMAAECGAVVGSFAIVHNALMDSASRVDGGDLSFLQHLLPPGARDGYSACVRESAPNPRVIAGLRVGESIAIDGTPTVFLNGWRVDPPTSQSVLNKWLDKSHAGLPTY